MANYPNVTIPTNIDVERARRRREFGAFYAALFDETLEAEPRRGRHRVRVAGVGAIPCPGPTLDQSTLATLGLDVIERVQAPIGGNGMGFGGVGGGGGMSRAGRGGWGNPLAMTMVLTRLHARYGKDITNDLEFKAAQPIVGGREFVVDANTHTLEKGAQPSSMNNFQGRYAIRHEWKGEISAISPELAAADDRRRRLEHEVVRDVLAVARVEPGEHEVHAVAARHAALHRRRGPARWCGLLRRRGRGRGRRELVAVEHVGAERHEVAGRARDPGTDRRCVACHAYSVTTAPRVLLERASNSAA